MSKKHKNPENERQPTFTKASNAAKRKAIDGQEGGDAAGSGEGVLSQTSSSKRRRRHRGNSKALSKDRQQQTTRKASTVTDVEKGEPSPAPVTAPRPDDDGGGSTPQQKWSKSKKKRMRVELAKQKKLTAATAAGVPKDASTTNSTTSSPQQSSKHKDDNQEMTVPTSAIQDAFKARLAGSRFRILNEELYTTTSDESYQRFSQNPELFEQYHEGFRHQVETWPENPVDVLVRNLTKTYVRNNNNKPIAVADFGCGDAQLAKDLLDVKKKQVSSKVGASSSPPSLFQVHSFDLVAPNKLVTACDMAHVPLTDASVDVAIFCLSLMGTNLADFVREAHRVLKPKGVVHIAEVRSRIEYSHSSLNKSSGNGGGGNGKDKNNKDNSNNKKAKNNSSKKMEGTLEEFVHILEQLGFQCAKTDRSNTMFLLLELRKNGKTPDKTLEFSAKPCIYKRR